MGMPDLTANDLKMITDHLICFLTPQLDSIKEHVDERVSSSEDLFSHQTKALQMIHETNYTFLLGEIKSVKTIAKSTEEQAKLTNGRVTKLDRLVLGETGVDGEKIKGQEGVLSEVKVLKKLLFGSFSAIFILGIFVFVDNPDLLDIIMKFIGLFKNFA